MIEYKVLTECPETKNKYLKRILQKHYQTKIYERKVSPLQIIKNTELFNRKVEKERLQTPFMCYQFRTKKLRTYSKQHYDNIPVNSQNNSNRFIKYNKNELIKQMNYSSQHIEQSTSDLKPIEQSDNLFRPLYNLQDRRQKTPLKLKLQHIEFTKQYQKLVDTLVELDKNPGVYQQNLFI